MRRKTYLNILAFSLLNFVESFAEQIMRENKITWLFIKSDIFDIHFINVNLDGCGH